MDDKILREDLISALTKEQAHLSLEAAIENLKPGNRNISPSPNLHSVWQLLEHIRISQEDILQYIINPEWKSPEWPEGYWSIKGDKITDSEWDESISKFNNNLKMLIEIVNNEKIDLTSVIPHTKNHSYLREILIVIDHNSYHIAQIIQTRKALGDWKI